MDVSITDGDNRIYANPASYTFSLYCNHAITEDYGIRITWPSDYVVIDRSSCTFVFTDGGSTYYCKTDAENNQILVTGFTSSTIAAKESITFTIDSIINPGVFDAEYGEIIVETIEEDGTSVVDTGAFQQFQSTFTYGNVTEFTVKPQSSSVGMYPVKYDFSVVPNGDVPRYGYLELSLPDEIVIIEENDFENACGEDLYAFTNTVISCVVTNGGRTIQIKDGFLYAASTNMTGDDGLYYPPDIQFTLDGF